MKRVHYLLLCSLMTFMVACEKDTMPVQFAPSVTTGNATEIYRKGAVLSGSIQLGSTATTKSYGILFSELESMAEYIEYPVTDGSKDFSVSLSNLTPGTTYYYSAYANSGYNMAKGQVKNFTTPPSNAPIFTEVILLEKDEFSCKVSASLFDEGGSEISLSGFCWTKEGEGTPTTESQIQNVTISGNSMTAVIEGLEPNSTYLVRAYAINSDGVGYSEITTIRTDEATTPVLSAITMKDSLDFSVTVEAQVTDSGTSAVSKVGFCWSNTNHTPTLDDATNDLTNQLTSENSVFHSDLSDLTPNTTYYIRAYATNEVGTTYSEVFTFTTAEAKAPTLSAITKKDSSDFSVSLEAEITDGGTSAITKAGYCWSTENKEPTISDTTKELVDQLTDENKKLGLSLSDLKPSTTYYIRAYATNEVGTTYSEVFTFTTAEVKAPSLSAITQKESSNFSVTVEAQVTDGGTSTVTKVGFCWSTTNEAPTIEDSTNDLTAQLTDGNTTFNAALSELDPSTTYFIRAYATNEVGTTYSEVFTFTTAEAKTPTLSAISQKESSDFSVTIETEITDSGTSSITKAGFCWSTENKEPTTSDTTKELTDQLTDENKKMSLSLSELTPGTSYYIRAYAINAFGVTYSAVFTFKTPYKDASNGYTGINSLPTTEWK